VITSPAVPNKIKVAVIGAGHWGPNLIRNFYSQEHSHVDWVVDRDAERLKQVSKRFPEVKVGADPEQVWSDPNIDAVVIATPTSTHHALVKAALERGKHVLVEKPIAADVREAQELTEIAEKAKRVLMVGHVFVYNGAVRRVKEYLNAGDLGQLYYISMVRTNLGPIRMDVNAAWDLASHDISIVNYWLDSEPVTASAVGGVWINPKIEDAVFATLKYPSGVLVNLHASWLNPRKSRDITLVGERRMLTFDDMNLQEPVRVYDKQVTDARMRPGFIDTFATFRASVRDGDITIPKVSTGEPLKTECDHFIECVLQGKQPTTDGKSGTAVVRALAAIERSVANRGKEEKVE
jgi:predicted dehydrogenase